MDYFNLNTFQKATIDAAMAGTGAWIHDGFEEAVILNCIGGNGEGSAWIVCPWDDNKAPEGVDVNPLEWDAAIYLADYDSGAMGGIVYNGTYAECIAALQRLCGGSERIYDDYGNRTYPVSAEDIVIDGWWRGADHAKPMTLLVAEQ